MSLKIYLALLVAVPGMTFASVSPVCNLLDRDLAYVHNSMKQNLAVYTFDANLRARADAAFETGKLQTALCKSDQDYLRTIRAYFASYNDPHLAPWWTIRADLSTIVKVSLGHDILPTRVKTQYMATGVLVHRLGNGYYVKSVDVNQPGANLVQPTDQLISCDDKTPSQILQNEILPFEGVSSVPASSYLFANRLFFRWDKIADSKSLCVFSRSGNKFVAELPWTPVDESYLKDFNTNVSPEKLYSIEARPYGHWIQLNSFAGYSAEQSQQLAQFVADAQGLRGDRVVVLDLRGNSGGNSSWGNQWIENLYGYLPGAEIKSNFVLSSPGNIGHYERVFKFFAENGGFPSIADQEAFSKFLELMKANPDKLVSLGEPGAVLPPKPQVPSQFRGQLYVISDSGVFSSGELFLQTLRLIPGVIQVGMATNASTLAGDIRFDQTPDGLVFSIGTKVFQNIFIGRDPGQPLLPQIEILQDPQLEFKGVDSVRKKLEEIIFNTNKE